MNLPAKKSLGQHWLDDQPTLDSIIEIAGVGKNDFVLEVGPGHGSLTKKLLARGANVVAVELDDELADSLSRQINSDNLEVINENILSFNLTALPKGYKVVANIPYYLTSKLVRTFSESANPPSVITLLVQKEVAERICAKPGEMSILSVSAQAYFECTLGPIVSADKFSPPPKVDSRVVKMVRLNHPQFGAHDGKKFFRVVKAGFSSRRKTLQNSLSGGLQLSKGEVESVLNKLSVDVNTRAQELSVEQWVKLTQYLTR